MVIVEGKTGWLKFTGVCLLIAVIEGIVVQVPICFVSSFGAALGASGVIFGLLGIAALWAPESEMSCRIYAWRLTRPIQIPVLGMAFFYFVLQVIPLVIFGFRSSSELLHLVGLAIGLPIGIVMLRLRWVDCDGWEFFSRAELSPRPPA